MPKKPLVIDANILIRAVLGTRARDLIQRHCETTAFFVADANYEEALSYLSELAPARGISDSVWKDALSTVMQAIQFVAMTELQPLKAEAGARIAARDINDWPAVAAAMLFDCPVWTEDADFFGAGVATWTTVTVEIYLSPAAGEA